MSTNLNRELLEKELNGHQSRLNGFLVKYFEAQETLKDVEGKIKEERGIINTLS